jgi:branched-subunit amino acid aminotransferase/4-amino-4-deoxychorismate lyase
MAADAHTDGRDVVEWREGRLRPAPGDESGELLVADSWLVIDGAVRAYEEHWRRFGGSCRELGVEGSDLDDFAVAVTAALPRRGEWFPRVELARVGNGRRLALRMRPAPEREHEARVWSAPRNDLRRHPRRKGPDLAWLSSLRSRAQKAGADEALIQDERGHLLEGALSSLLWWEDEALCTTPDEASLPGVTRNLLFRLAEASGVEVRRIAPEPQRLAGREVWLTSALQGIRTVSDWVEPQQAAGPPTRAVEWRSLLDGFVRPLAEWESAVPEGRRTPKIASTRS